LLFNRQSISKVSIFDIGGGNQDKSLLEKGGYG